MKKKIISLILISILLIFSFQNYVNGFDFNEKKNEILNGEGDEEVIEKVTDIAGTAITVTQVIAVGVAIIMLIVLAIRYMGTAPGEKATIKKHAVVYVVGAVVMFSVTGILQIIKQLSTAFSVEE